MDNTFGVIIQARIGSSRFKNKVIKKIMKKPLLFHVIRRVQQAQHISNIVVATTEKEEDKILEYIAKASKVPIFFGNTADVLDRYFQAAKKFNFHNIVRITADCPVIDPCIIDKTIDKFNEGDYDYVSNCLTRTFPEGMSVEVFTFDALKRAWQESSWTSEREHVTPYIWKNSHIFKLGELLNANGNQSDIRLTVDFPRDFILIQKIYRNLYPSYPYFLMPEILRFLSQNPTLLKINNDIQKLEGYYKSLNNDKLLDNRFNLI